MRSYINLKNWNYNLGKYSIDKSEAQEILRAIERNQPKVVRKNSCPVCHRGVYERPMYCSCGQRLIFAPENRGQDAYNKKGSRSQNRS